MTAREAARLADAAARRPPAGSGRLLWLLCFVSFCGLQSIQFVGTIGAVLFLAPWFVIVPPRLSLFVAGLTADRILLALPVLALVSTLWSTDPAATLRGALEYGATIGIGIAIARCVALRTVMTSLMSALAVVTAGSLVVAWHRGISLGSDDALSGLYGSKNQLASFSAVAFIIAAGFATSRLERTRFRVLAAAIALGSLLAFVLGRSAGALVALLSSGAILYVLRQSRLGRSTFPILVGFFGVIAIYVVLTIGLQHTYVDALHTLGKDRSLTGRTYLWDEGIRQLGSHFVFGEGYQAFWVPGNPIAQQIWRKFGIYNHIGFHFHNTLIELGVELGIVGVVLFCLTLVRPLIWSLSDDRGEGGRLALLLRALFLFYLALSFIEVEYYGQFSLTPLLLCLCSRPRRSGGPLP